MEASAAKSLAQSILTAESRRNLLGRGSERERSTFSRAWKIPPFAHDTDRLATVCLCEGFRMPAADGAIADIKYAASERPDYEYTA
jgi:hypothetical protein